MNTIKSKIYLILMMFAFSCTQFQQRNPSSSLQSSKPNHYIITVHGLSGNSETFGFFGEATQKYMSQLNNNYNYKPLNFTYPTGKSEKYSAYDFAFSENFGLNQFIKNLNLSKDDKLSFVCHSQGGIVTYLWFFNNLLNTSSNNFSLKQVDSIITLGTPFWGSKIASILTDNRNPDILGLIKLFAPDNYKMTRQEISDLAFASDTINSLRLLSIKMDNDPSIAELIEQLPLRLINITGVLPQDKNDLYSQASKNGFLVTDLTKKIINVVYKIFSKSYKVLPDGKFRIESDIAVPVPSSRWNFIYTQSQKIKNDIVVDDIQYRDFKHFVDKSKYLFTESAHFPFDNENTLSMAYINKECLLVETCNHPTYRYIIEHLSNCKNNTSCDANAFENIVQKMKAINLAEHQNFKEIAKYLKSFAIQINLKLMPGVIDNLPFQYFRKKMGNDELLIGNDAWELNDYSLLDGKVINLNTDKKTHLANISNENYKIYLAEKNEKHSIDIVSRKATKKDPFDRIRIHIMGKVEKLNDLENLRYVVPVDIKIPGLPKVKLNILVQPSYSTFTELDYTN